MIYSLITEWSHRIVTLHANNWLKQCLIFSPSFSHALFLTVQCTFWGWGKIFFNDVSVLYIIKWHPATLGGPQALTRKEYTVATAQYLVWMQSIKYCFSILEFVSFNSPAWKKVPKLIWYLHSTKHLEQFVTVQLSKVSKSQSLFLSWSSK